jgi:hypothetical protein
LTLWALIIGYGTGDSYGSNAHYTALKSRYKQGSVYFIECRLDETLQT